MKGLYVLDVDETKIKMSYSVQNEMDRRQKNVAMRSPFVHIQDNSANQLKIALINTRQVKLHFKVEKS